MRMGSSPIIRTMRSVFIGSEYPTKDTPHFYLGISQNLQIPVTEISIKSEGLTFAIRRAILMIRILISKVAAWKRKN